MEINYKYVGDSTAKYNPHHATEGASGADLRNATGQIVIIPPGEVVKIRTGIAAEIPSGYEGQLRPRSGISVKKKVIMLPSIGTIDADFRGEIQVAYFNPTNKNVFIEHGERIAQLIIAPYERCNYRERESLTETARGVGGFGSTGT